MKEFLLSNTISKCSNNPDDTVSETVVLNNVIEPI